MSKSFGEGSKSFTEGRALLIGVGEDLPDTVKDARCLADILKDPARCAYQPNHVSLLTGEAADRYGILAGLDRLARAADERSTVVIYFSGHGYNVASSSGRTYYLMPFGYDVRRLSETAINGQEFVQRLKAIKSRKLLLLLDCCHAGGFANLMVQDLRLAKAPMPLEAQGLLSEGQGRVVIASSKADEFSLAGRPYSVFTMALIEALSGIGASKEDGFVRAADLALHVREMVPKRTKGRQHPILSYEKEDNFVLAYYSGGETRSKGLPFREEPRIEPEPGAWRDVFDQRGQNVRGPQTNIAGNVQGSVLSGTFSGPVSAGSDAVDFRGSVGTIFRPAGPVSQHIGDVNVDLSGREGSSSSHKDAKKIKALFLASNPKGTTALELDREIRSITEKIRASEYRDSIDLISAWAVRPDDLLQLLDQHRPQIVYFSGHGERTGEIILADSQGKLKSVSPSAIKALFQALKDNIRLVILNACYSKKQAEAITEVIDCAIGMNDAIGDEGAIAFAASFYRALGFGRSIKQAFDQGIVVLLLEGIPEDNKPELLTGKGVDPAKIFLVEQG